MINMSEAAVIALHSMVYIANRKNEIHSLKSVSAFFEISPNHLSKVLQRLVKAGYLISVKGPQGGFKLHEGKENSTLLEIYEVIEGKYTPAKCLFICPILPEHQCMMEPLVKDMDEIFRKFMTGNTISTLKIQNIT